MLKLAIIRVNDRTGKYEIMLDAPLAENLAEALHALHRPGFRTRNVRRAIEALGVVEAHLKNRTIQLT